MMKWDLVIFDLDGTLLDTIEDLGAAVEHSMRESHFPGHTVAEYRRMVGHGIRNLVMAAMPESARTDESKVNERLASFVDYYVSNIDVHTRPYEGVHDLLKELSREGTRVAIASNKFQTGTEKLVGEFFGDIPFCAILGNKEGLPLKPDPEVVGLCRRAAELPVGARIAFVGDSPTDMRTAAAAGVAAIGVTWGFRDEPEIKAAGAQTIARTPAELKAILL